MVFDTDGVVTKTAAVHFAAWKRLFDDELRRRAGGDDFEPFTHDDYRRYVDGKPREDGVASFLASRGIDLPFGTADDPPGPATVHALGNEKNDHFLAQLRADGVEAFPSTVSFVEALRAAGVRTGVISASKNCAEVLEAAGVDRLFDVRVDGLDAAELGFAGKPDPAIFLEAARRLGVAPERVAIVEDAVAGVEAGRRGGLRARRRDRSRRPPRGADRPRRPRRDRPRRAHRRRRRCHRPPRATRGTAAVAAVRPRRRRIGLLLEGRSPAVFLDYDGTLTPIVARPELAVLPPATGEVLDALAARCTVGIISGRDLDDVRAMVGRGEHLWFAGSHGFDIASPEGWRRDIEAGRDVLPQLDAAEAALREQVPAVPEAWVERKRFAIAVHYRQTPDEHVDRLERLVAEVAEASPGLRLAGGKKIFELRPDIPWDKGKALQHILEVAGVDPATSLAVYIGDDVTDEDAFVAIRTTGVGIVVGDEDRPTAARFRVDDTDQVRDFLRLLLDHAEGDA
ncbi:MAG: trehalose-phosphatase [Acidimicrobiales bacterium]